MVPLAPFSGPTRRVEPPWVSLSVLLRGVLLRGTVHAVVARKVTVTDSRSLSNDVSLQQPRAMEQW